MGVAELFGVKGRKAVRGGECIGRSGAKVGGVAGSGDPYLFVTLIWRWVSCGHLCITLHSLPQGSRREIATSLGWHMGDNPVLLSPAEVLEAVAHDHADKGASTSAQDVGARAKSTYPLPWTAF